MANPVLDAPHFRDEAAAFEFVEAALWPDGPFCPHCGEWEKIKRLAGKSTRPGLFQCRGCSGQFTVRNGTIFESSHLELRLWLQVIHLMMASKKGIATRQIQRMLGCSMKTAWFLGHRVRELLAPAADASPLGGEGEVVEADLTFIGRKKGEKVRRAGPHMNKVLALVERGGEVRAFHVTGVRADNLYPVMQAHISKASRLHTDEALVFKGIGSNFAEHATTNHRQGEYHRKPDVHSNSAENFFGVMKKGIYGVYQSVSEEHLGKYMHEFAFRHSYREGLGVNDTDRALIALVRARGRRLTYQTVSRKQPVSRRAG